MQKHAAGLERALTLFSTSAIFGVGFDSLLGAVSWKCNWSGVPASCSCALREIFASGTTLKQKKKLLAACRSVVGEPSPELVLSLSGVTAVDSLGIGALARIVTGCVRRNIALKVAMPKGIPREVLERIGIFRGWPRLEDEAPALPVRAER